MMRFAGYAAVFDRPDHGGDIVRPGAFKHAKPGVPLYCQHDATRRIGTVDHLEEDAKGLRVLASVETGSVKPGDGLSFGYRVVSAKRSKGTYRELNDLELIEVSLVNSPMQPLARVLAVEAL